MSLLQMSFYGTVMIIVIVIIRMLTINKLAKRTFLVFWGIVLIRLILPFTIPSSFSIYSQVNIPNFQELIPATTINPSEQLETVTLPLPIETNEQLPIETNETFPIETNEQLPIGTIETFPIETNEQLPIGTIETFPIETNETLPIGTNETLSTVPSEQFIENPSSFLPSILTIIWMIGSIVLAVFFIVTYVTCRREFQNSLPIDNEFVKNWKIAHKLKRTVDIRQSDRIKAPLTYGIFCPVILLPDNTNWKDIESVKHVLLHEYIHIRRFDAITKLILTLAVCLHWFNPLVWLMYILANKDIELSCDESVIHTLGEKEKSAYAYTLINMEEKKSRFTPLYNNFSKSSIETRIRSIMKIKKTSFKKTLLSVLLVVSVTTIFVTASPAQVNFQHINERFTSDISKIDIDIANYSIFIETHDSDEIIVEANIENSKYENPLIVEISGDTLEITQIHIRNNSRGSYPFGTGTIVVTAPIDSKYDYDIWVYDSPVKMYAMGKNVLIENYDSEIELFAPIEILSGKGFAEGDFEYTIENNKAIITRYTGSAENLTIPKTLGGYGITRIGDYAFNECSSLTSIEIPDSVTSIGDMAFYECSSLTAVEIPNSVTSISNFTFYGCSSLTTVEIPDSVTSIGDWAFSGCESLTSIEIPDSVTSIGDMAFYDSKTGNKIYLEI